MIFAGVMKMKIWKNNVEVDEYGRIFKRVKVKGGSKLQPAKVYKNGRYPTITYKDNGKKKIATCHRVVAETYLGRPLQGVETVHHCNHQRNDYQVSNLCVVSRATHDIIEANELRCRGNLK